MTEYTQNLQESLDIIPEFARQFGDSSAMMVVRRDETSSVNSSVTIRDDLHDTDQLKYLVLDDEETTKWNGDFKSLQNFVENSLKLKGKWSTPGGGSKLFQNDDLSIRWYTPSKSMKLAGPKLDDIKSKLESLVKLYSERSVVEESNDSCNNVALQLNVSHLEGEVILLKTQVESLSNELKTNQTSVNSLVQDLYKRIEIVEKGRER